VKNLKGANPFPVTLFEGKVLEGRTSGMEGMRRKRI
jgi:hypothetical protein